jgi:hypothetical protein
MPVSNSTALLVSALSRLRACYIFCIASGNPTAAIVHTLLQRTLAKRDAKVTWLVEGTFELV